MSTRPPSSSALRASQAPEMPLLFPFDCLPASIGHSVRDAVLGKKTVFGREMTEVGDVGVVKKKNRGNAGSASLYPSRPWLKVDTESSAAELPISFYTVKPLLSGPPIKRTPSIKRTLSRVPKLTSYISLYNEPLFSGQ